MELTWQNIWWCLMRVPVRHWRTLFHYLRRLDSTLEEGRALGRRWITWHVRSDGVIWISDWDETEAERKRRFALPDGFDREAWQRAGDRFERGWLAGLGHTFNVQLAGGLLTLAAALTHAAPEPDARPLGPLRSRPPP